MDNKFSTDFLPDLIGLKIENVHDNGSWFTLSVGDGIFISVHKGFIEYGDDFRFFKIKNKDK